MTTTDSIAKNTEYRLHNGQCAYGSWESILDLPADVRDAIADEILECSCRDMRHEAGNGNAEHRGRVTVGGQIYLYRA